MTDARKIKTVDEVNCNGCAICAKKCPENAISGKKKELHTIEQAKCIKCGICKDVCKYDAVNVQ